MKKILKLGGGERDQSCGILVGRRESGRRRNSGLRGGRSNAPPRMIATRKKGVKTRRGLGIQEQVFEEVFEKISLDTRVLMRINTCFFSLGA